jgi:hypothetical protein
MGRSIRFPSLGKGDQYGYILHSSDFTYGFGVDAPRCVAPWAGSYETYGDGMTQHSPDSCCSVTFMADYLASLTVFCLDERNADALDVMAAHWKPMTRYDERTKLANILKARQVRHKEGKTRYVMAREFTLSTSEAKRHDKRWYQIVEWMDGSIGATFGVLHMDLNCGLYGVERYLTLNRIINAFNEIDGYCSASPCDHFDRFKGQRLDEAFAAFEEMMEADYHRRLAAPLLQTYQQAIERDAAKGTTQTA